MELEIKYREIVSTVIVNRYVFQNTVPLREFLVAAVSLQVPQLEIFNLSGNKVNLNSHEITILLKKLVYSTYYNKYNYEAILKLINSLGTQAEIDAVNIEQGWHSE
jgi:hypothetical protein